MLSGFNPQEIQDLEGARSAILALLNLVESMKQENQALRDEVQRMRDENNRLKGEQGKPDIKPNKSDDLDETDHSSEKERNPSPKGWSKKSKRNKIVVDREETLTVDESILPTDAQFKGYEEVVVQDIKLTTDTVLFRKEKYYSPPRNAPIWPLCLRGTWASLVLACAPWS